MTRATRRVRPEHDPKVTVQRVSTPAPIRRLVVGAAHDPAEADADRMAEKALRVAQSWRRGSTEAPVRRSTPAGTSAPLSKSFQIDAQVVDDASAGGQSLPDPIRRSMESGFGADFANVRVHNGPVANEVSKSIGARAFTRGSDLFFGAGEYRPGSDDGDHVIAHELAHVVQSGPAGGRANVHRFPATALSAPVNWGAHKPTVFHPGEGLSGGVYIFTSTAGDASVKKVVVKPVFGRSGIGTRETGEQLVFGDRALSALIGVSTPKSRVVQRGTPEFRTLVGFCLPHYPKPAVDSPEAEDWKPLSQAESFVVMGEVPNASSVGSMADKAAGGGKAAADLHSAVFSHGFLSQLGKLCVGDLLIGNSDRMVARAMNLGNVMVAMGDKGAELWAIDTAAVLDKFDPKEVADAGSASSALQGGFSSTKQTFKDTPADVLKGFYDTLAKRMTRATKPDTPKSGDNRTPAQIFTDTYTTNLPKFVSSFEYGWQEGLIAIYALLNTKTGRKKMKALTAEQGGTAGEENLKYDALKVNAAYLAAKAEGAEHEDAGKDAATLAAYKTLAQFNPASVALPVDQFFWNVAKPNDGMYSAELEHPPALPGPNAIFNVAQMPKFSGYDAEKLQRIGQAATEAKNQADSLGTKKRGLLRKEVPRNRVLAARFVADSYNLGAGAARAAGYGGPFKQAVDAVELVVGSNMKGSQAAKVLPAAQFASAYTKTFADNLKNYETSLVAASAAVRKIHKYAGAPKLAEQLDKMASLVNEGEAQVLEPIRKKKPEAMYNALKALAALKR